jgi:hypothetical protein
MANGNVPPLEQQVPRAAVGHRWAVRRPSRLPRDGATSRLRREIIPDPALVVTMDPTWGHQKIFQHYRARLRELHNDGTGKASLLVSFRESNSVVEGWLRQKVPDLMTQIDALYADAAAQAT